MGGEWEFSFTLTEDFDLKCYQGFLVSLKATYESKGGTWATAARSSTGEYAPPDGNIFAEFRCTCDILDLQNLKVEQHGDTRKEAGRSAASWRLFWDPALEGEKIEYGGIHAQCCDGIKWIHSIQEELSENFQSSFRIHHIASVFGDGKTDDHDNIDRDDDRSEHIFGDDDDDDDDYDYDDYCEDEPFCPYTGYYSTGTGHTVFQV